ncbi:MAG: ribosome maturation factor RimP [Elusimicrobiota bacterium]
MKSITQRLTDIVKPFLEEGGYDFIDLRYGKRGSGWYLQIFTDKSGGITVDDCKNISREIGYELDRHPDLIRHSYSLEVSSPGLDRPLITLADFGRHLNEEIVLSLFSPVTGSKKHTARIISADTKGVEIEIRDGSRESVEYDNIVKANIEVKI